MHIKKIACCTDFSENAEMAFVTALDLAEKYKAKLFVIHVSPPLINYQATDTEWMLPYEPEEPLMLELEKRMDKEYGARIGEHTDYKLVVLSGHVSTEILSYLKEKNIDLVVMGSYGLSGMGLVFFGSVAKRVARKSPCSVMIVRKKKEIED
ncbi:MAG: universal stress protein [Proteobacteria bacterium]|nr:universal stress protein [Pseudomonadota bacterium]